MHKQGKIGLVLEMRDGATYKEVLTAACGLRSENIVNMSSVSISTSCNEAVRVSGVETEWKTKREK